MQKVMLVSNDESLNALNKELEEDQFEIIQVAGNANGSWLVVLDDENFEDLEDMFDYEDEEAEQQK